MDLEEKTTCQDWLHSVKFTLKIETCKLFFKKQNVYSLFRSSPQKSKEKKKRQFEKKKKQKNDSTITPEIFSPKKKTYSIMAGASWGRFTVM